MKVLILGKGQLGKEIKSQTDWDLVCIEDQADFDYNHIENCYKYLVNYDVIVNCVAHTDTYSKQKEPHWTVNYYAVSRLTDWCRENNKKLVHISTDFVYANSSSIASEESLPVHDKNWYSYTKLLADGYIELKGENYLLIRTSFKPKPFPYDEAYTDILTCADYIDNIAAFIIQLINEERIGIYNVGTEPKTIYTLAKQTKPDVKKGLSKEWMPKDLRMNCDKFKNR